MPSKTHPVPVPYERYRGPRLTADRERQVSGYTSVRVTRRTAELLRRLIQQAATAQKKRSGKEGPYYYLPNISVDELLYWDALQRLGELPEGVK